LPLRDWSQTGPSAALQRNRFNLATILSAAQHERSLLHASLSMKQQSKSITDACLCLYNRMKSRARTVLLSATNEYAGKKQRRILSEGIMCINSISKA
jgi:hypothetical protein